MIAALLLVSLQTAPPDLKLPIEKFKAIADRLVAQPHFPSFCPQRGLMVSDDGTYFVTRTETDANVIFDSGTVDGLSLFEQPGDPKLPAISASQKYMIDDKPDDKGKLFPPAEVEDVLAARGDGYSTLLHVTKDDGKGGKVRRGISTAHYANTDPTKNQSIAWLPAGREARAYAADIATDSFLMAEWERPEGGDYKDLGAFLVGAKTGGPYKFIPGITPFLLDTSRDLVICFLYTEQGTPFGYANRTLENDKANHIVGPENAGLPRCAALLSGGRLIAWFAPRDEDEKAKPGLYMTSGDFGKWEYLGPYALEGSSANGKVLLLSHLDLRRSYVVWPK